MSQKEKELKRIAQDFGVAPLDLEDAIQLPNIMGWAGSFDYLNYRAKTLEEIAKSLGEPVDEIPDQEK